MKFKMLSFKKSKVKKNLRSRIESKCSIQNTLTDSGAPTDSDAPTARTDILGPKLSISGSKRSPNELKSPLMLTQMDSGSSTLRDQDRTLRPRCHQDLQWTHHLYQDRVFLPLWDQHLVLVLVLVLLSSQGFHSLLISNPPTKQLISYH